MRDDQMMFLHEFQSWRVIRRTLTLGLGLPALGAAVALVAAYAHWGTVTGPWPVPRWLAAVGLKADGSLRIYHAAVITGGAGGLLTAVSLPTAFLSRYMRGQPRRPRRSAQQRMVDRAYRRAGL